MRFPMMGYSSLARKKLGYKRFLSHRIKVTSKKFLGLANYFRDHVENHSILAQPLNNMLTGYTRGHRAHPLLWTDELSTVFYSLRDSVASSPKLYFINEIWDIGLTTDANDYGIGFFCFRLTLTQILSCPYSSSVNLSWVPK